MRSVVVIAAGIVLAVVVLFVGSAMVAGIADANRQEAVRQAAAKLTPASDVLALNLRAVKAAPRRRLTKECLDVAASAFRLAEARNLQLEQADAVGLVVADRYFVQALAEAGFNARAVVAGLAARVYAKPLPPAEQHAAALRECAQAAPGGL